MRKRTCWPWLKMKSDEVGEEKRLGKKSARGFGHRSKPNGCRRVRGDERLRSDWELELRFWQASQKESVRNPVMNSTRRSENNRRRRGSVATTSEARL